MRRPSTWSLALGAVGLLSTMLIAMIASLFQQTHYAGHDKEKTRENARHPQDIDEHPQATMIRLVEFSEPLLGEVRAKTPQRKPTSENHQNSAEHHEQNDRALWRRPAPRVTYGS
jgi:hypothetical protein